METGVVSRWGGESEGVGVGVRPEGRRRGGGGIKVERSREGGGRGGKKGRNFDAGL